MADMRTWSVKSNSYRPDYAITGTTIIEAVERSFERIARDALRSASTGYRLVSAWAEYRTGILRGRGGVELTIEFTGRAAPKAAADQAVRRAVVWIHANQEDLPKRHDFAIRTTEASVARFLA